MFLFLISLYGGVNLHKRKEHIALMIFVPMLVFTFIVTVNSKSYSYNSDNAEKIIYKYYDYKNQKDINSISKLLYNKDELDKIKLKVANIDEINVLSVKEVKNDSLLNLYSKLNNQIQYNDIKIYKVIYSISYKSEETYKNGKYETWCFLVKDHDSNNWKLDVYDY